MDRDSEWVARATGGRHVGPVVTVTSSVETDTRALRRGSLFVARRGENADGHDYLPAAVEAGAVCAIVDHEVPGADITQVVVDDTTAALGVLAREHLLDLRADGPIDVVAVTGSAGKTTTKDLILQILDADAPTIAPRMSFNNEVGLPLTVLRADAATRHLVLEMGASAIGEIENLTSIARPDVSVVLMVGHAHLGGFGSVEGIARAKSEIVTGTRPGGTVILNADDPRVLAMSALTEGPVIRFSTDDSRGTSGDAEIWASGITTDGAGHARFTLHTPTGTGDVALRIVGAHHVHNALAAAAVGHVEGITAEVLAERLSTAEPLSPHRMAVHELVVNGHPITLIDDSYNANIDSMRAALVALEEIAGDRRRIAVLGEMLELGNTTNDQHVELGELVAAAGVSRLVALGPGMLDCVDTALGLGVRESNPAQRFEDALTDTLDNLTDGSVILVKGSHDSGAWRVADALLQLGGVK